MGYAILIAGLLLWSSAHFFKRLAPVKRAAMGDKGKGPIALVLLVSIVVMVVGFRMTDHVDLWYPPSWTVHLNNLLVVIAVFMMSPAPQKGRLLSGMRHPMLVGMKIWALAHLLVNGDLASIILFAGLMAWAVVSVIVINKAEPVWQGRTPGRYAKDAMFFVISIVLVVIIGLIHGWLGPYPFAGG